MYICSNVPSVPADKYLSYVIFSLDIGYLCERSKYVHIHLCIYVCVQIGTIGHSIHDEIIEALKAWADRNYKKSIKYIHKVIFSHVKA